MRKNSSKYAIFLLCALFVPSFMHGEWWTVSVEKKKVERTDYSKKYGTDLRKYSTLFPEVPKSGKIRWHHVLGVKKDATEKEIKHKLFELIRATHTDQGLQENGELIKAINAIKDEVRSPTEYTIVWGGTSHSSFRNYKGPGIVPHVDSLAEFFLRGGEEKKAKKVDDETFPEKFKKLTTDWKRFYIMKFALLVGLATSYRYLKNLSESDKDSWLKRNKTVQKFIAWWPNFKKKHPKKATLLKVCGRGGFIALASIYPLYRFRKLFSWGSLNTHYRSETMHNNHISDDDLKLFYRMVHVATRTTRNSDGTTTSTPIYEPTFPIGYMTSEQERERFMPIRKAQVMNALTAATSFATFWIGCI